MTARRPLYAYYYPAHHRTQSGWFEWDLVRAARPWFEGHAKPDVPAWGELDDAQPATLVRQTHAAAAAGIDGFVFDTWWRPDGATLYGETLREAVLPADAELPEAFRFGILWCPVWPRVRLPVGMADPSTGHGTDRMFPFTAADLRALVDHLLPYLAHRRAIRIDGRPLLAVFHAWRLAAELGVGAADAIAAMREHARRRGLPGLYLAGCINGPADVTALATIGLDALTSYVWWPDWNGPARQDYRALTEQRVADWARVADELAIPYLPSIAAGWDATPRGTRAWDGVRLGFPWTPVVEGATPDAVAAAVARGLAFLDERGAPGDQPVMIASWNEWSESHRLEPCLRWGDGYLRALAALRR
ncbi:MAG: glycoside hydrolase family 99-like domain-containing protein [Deltaproteobacteria bacterium]|nr:glycoside hydrolase family 99-like domain-containing protein [Deltaproteobacteria bacterium]